MKADYGVDYDDESKRYFFEKLFNFSKFQIKESMSMQREKPYEKMLNAASSHNEVPKK